MATRPREAALKSMSIPSIARQTRSLDALVIVTDRCRLAASTENELQALLPSIRIHNIPNSHIQGVAGAWNTGLSFIHQHWPKAYVAILDDDDAWDADHLATCSDLAEQNDLPDVVMSGLRLNKAGATLIRPPLITLAVDDFLVGNPGWQGSNTFATIGSLLNAGGFSNGLISCNDRDLAIRMLSLPDIRISYTGKFTATWNLNASADSLSQVGPQKQESLRRFLAIHGHRMSPKVKQGFFQRCMDLFGVSEGDLT